MRNDIRGKAIAVAMLIVVAEWSAASAEQTSCPEVSCRGGLSYDAGPLSEIDHPHLDCL